MSPVPLVQSLWDDVMSSLLYLALLHLSVVLFAGSILVARALIPSLIYTGHASERVGRLRLPVYGLAVIGGLLVITFAVLWIGNLGFLYDIYDRVWY